MSAQRIKSGFWLKAQLRLCDQACLPAFVVRRGDEDAGQILIKHNRLGRGCEIWVRRFDGDGLRVWMVVAGGTDLDSERQCDAYIEREMDIDPDLWVLEIEDIEGVYKPDGKDPVRE
ncbi:MAG: DUF1491 family protein [Magnetovibrio sp.]|nr:DUF1491 family protein [Magnetovibrio sp.]